MADAVDVQMVVSELEDVQEIPGEGFNFRTGGKGLIWAYPDREGGTPRDPNRHCCVVRRGRG
jgi:hypothetical protein